MEKINKDLLYSKLLSQDIKINKVELDNLWAFHNLILKYNKNSDLTRIINFDSMVTKHYVDSLIINKYLNFKEPVLDIGSGAGFPGIPIKITNPDLSITLAEPKKSRVDFLNLVIKTLNLKKITVHPHKIVRASNINKFNTVITRAFETIPKTLFRVEKLLHKNGSVIFMKGPNSDIEKGDAALASPFYSLSNDITYKISNKDIRKLIVFTYLKQHQ